MNDTDRETRIRAALARYEAKQSKRNAVKLFSVDKYEPERERAIKVIGRSNTKKTQEGHEGEKP